MVAGAGNIGSLIACLLANSGDYHVYLADLSFAKNDVIRLLRAIPALTTVVLDVQDQDAVQAYLQKKRDHRGHRESSLLFNNLFGTNS